MLDRDQEVSERSWGSRPQRDRVWGRAECVLTCMRWFLRNNGKAFREHEKERRKCGCSATYRLLSSLEYVIHHRAVARLEGSFYVSSMEQAAVSLTQR